MQCFASRYSKVCVCLLAHLGLFVANGLVMHCMPCLPTVNSELQWATATEVPVLLHFLR